MVEVSNHNNVYGWKGIDMVLVERRYEDLIPFWYVGTVEEYHTQFESILVSLRDALKKVLMLMFMNGLRCEIRAKFKFLRPATLKDVMIQAQEVEEKN